MTDTQQVLSVGRPSHESSGPRREQILAMHAEGRSGVAIARELGITPGAVSYHIKKAREAGTLVDPPRAEPEVGATGDE